MYDISYFEHFDLFVKYDISSVFPVFTDVLFQSRADVFCCHLFELIQWDVLYPGLLF